MFTDSSLPHLILARAAATPEAIAITCAGQSLSYRELHLRATAIAARLRDHGVGAESRVAVLAARHPATVVGILGIHFAGAAYVPLDPAYPRAVLEHTLRDCGATLLVGLEADLEDVPASGFRTLALDRTDPSAEPLDEIAPCPPSSLAYVIYTSGSTGGPKGVLVTHSNLAHSTEARIQHYQRPPERFLLVSSFAFDSSVAGLFWTLASGGTLVISTGEERDPAALAALIQREKITHTLCLPSLHAALIRTGAPLPSLQCVIVAGEACPTALPAAHAGHLSRVELWNEYGPTEATVWATVARLSPRPACVTIGMPIARTEVLLLDEEGVPVPDGEPGEIHVVGPGVAAGYLNRPELSAERFFEDAPGRWRYRTGDRARRLPDGALEFLGRVDRQVKIRGHRVELTAIEATLQSHPAVTQAAVLLREDDREPRLVAYIAPVDAPVTAIRRALALQLPAPHQPAAYVALAALPLTPNGKIDYAALPAPSRERPALDTPYAAPADPLEAHLASLWSSVLGLDTVGTHDRFFDLGGDSLRAAELCARLQQSLGEPVFVVALFEAPTIAQLARHLRRHYAAAIERHLGRGENAAPASRFDLTTIDRVRSLVAPSARTIPAPRRLSRRAIFILAPPRSGTTLLRAMLARHPQLFTISEARLLGFHTLAERNAAHGDRAAVWHANLAEAIARAKGCPLDEAEHLLTTYERLELGTGDCFALLQQWLGDRLLVDKSPSYALDPSCLAHAEALFEDAFYIHLSRHPYEVVRSFAERRMDQIYVPGADDLTPLAIGEAIWSLAHENIRAFLAKVPAHRQCELRFADLVQQPRPQLEALSHALGLPFTEEMLDPYAGVSASVENGTHTADDPRFLEHRALKPEIANGWRAAATDDFLSEPTWQLAAELGYERPHAREIAAPAVAISEPLPADAIAIIGLGGRFPGARTVDEFWRNLCDGVESLRPFTEDELRASGIDPAVLADPTYVNRGGQIDGADQFAAGFFGYTPREAELMDPQQRVLLECAWEAFEHAGCDVTRYPGAIGVFAGVALNDYFQLNLATRPELAPLLGSYQLTLGNEKDFVATRIAHKLRLRGPAVSVQTACSTSLVALHLACQSLRSGECDMALVGGGRISVPLHAGYHHVDGSIPSPDGRCRAFDAQAQGCVPTSGVAVVVIKRLADAMRDGDRIFSVIRGTAINNDGGDKAGFTAPSVEGQSAVIAQAHQAAHITADTIGYVEAHGTGTSLGDPIEIAGLTRAFRRSTDATGFCRLGSVKTNIGHLDAGAGAAGLIKTSLILDRGVIPPTLHFTAPNPQIDFAHSPFVVNAARTDWPRGAAPRRAGVSSFGIGGTNAHAVLEEAPVLESSAPSRPWQLLVLSARTASALDAATANLARHLREHPELNLADVAHTLQSGRAEFEHRRIVVARDVAEAADLLEQRDARRVFTGRSEGNAPGVVFLFPGQGAQYPGMARELFAHEPVFRDALQRCADLLRPRLDLLAALHDADDATLTDTGIAQLAIFSVEYALARLWESWGIKPVAALGHSLGEYTAACLAGVLTLEDSIDLIAERAQLMHAMPPGTMLAVRISESDLRPLLPAQVELASVNAPRLCVVSGPSDAIASFAAALSQRDIATVPLRTSHAFHSAMMEPAAAAFAALAASVPFQPPQLPLISTLTGSADADFTRSEYWARQMREPVRFSEAIATIPPGRVLLEVGPGATLTSPARQSCAAPVIPSQRASGEREQASMLEALGRLWIAGVPIDWTLLHRGERRLRVPLPTYPFERERYWLEPGSRAATSATPVASVDPAPTINTTPQATSGVDAVRALLHRLSGVPVEKLDPTATLLELGFDSLFLTQFALALRQSFGLDVTFRQLFEQLSTIEAIAAHIPSRTTAAPSLPTPAASAPSAPHGPFTPPATETHDTLTDAQRAHLSDLTARYTRRTSRSKERTQQHRAHLADPRTVSGFRPAWKDLTYPLIVERSSGARMWDIDGHEYLDFTMGFGTNLLGHSPACVTEAIAAQLARGLEIGPQSPLAGEVAQLLCEASGLDRAAFTNTGSEAVLAAVRVARTVTGRTLIATFSGYHGIHDEMLVRSRTIDGTRHSAPIAPGIPEHVASGVIALDYGCPASLEILRQRAHEIAAVLVEPVQSRHPDLQPREFLHEVRRITQEAGAALVFDEVITGFRCHPRGAQAWFDVRADLVTYGKIIGGGLPMGALCGTRRFMDALDGGDWSFGDDSRPEVGVTFFAGTFVRHPLALAASHAVLRFLKADGGALQQALNQRTAWLVGEMNALLAQAGAPLKVESFASMFFLKWNADFRYGAVLFFLLREKGIHAWDNRLFFLSTAHTEADLAHFLRVFRGCMEEMEPWFAGCERHWESTAAPSPAETCTLPLTPSQRGLFALALRAPDAGRAYNEPSALELRGPLDVARLETALQELVHRHEALRTTIAADGSTQTVQPHARLSLAMRDCPSEDAVHAAVAEVRAWTFDFARAPMIDARLLRRGPEDHVLLVTLHHIFCNGPSLGVFFSELTALYMGGALPPVMQLRDLVPLRLKPRAPTTEAFWKAQFAQPPVPLALPADRPRPAQKTYHGGRETLTFDATLTAAIRQAGAAHGASMFMTLLAGFQALLHRLSGQDDVVVGVPFEGSERLLPGGDRLIAFSTNVLPLRSRLAGDTTFAELLQAQRSLVLEATGHQDHFVGDLVSALGLPFDASRSPLFDVFFNYETGRFEREVEDLQVALVNHEPAFLALRGTSIGDLFLNVTEHRGELHLRCDFNRDLFDPATIRRWLAHLQTLLADAAADTTQLVARLPLLPDEERYLVVEEWNRHTLPFPADATMHALFEQNAARHPDACAILDHGRRVTYRELNARADAIAAQLQELGVRREDFVGVCMQRSVAMIAALFGVLKAGAAYVPLDPAYPDDRLRVMLEDSHARVVIGDESTIASHASQLPAARWVQPQLEGQPQPCSARGENVAYVIYTSGSTGRPKGVALEHRNAVSLIYWALDIFTPHELSGVLGSTSICFDVSIFEIFVTLSAGGTLVLAANVLELPRLPDADRVTLISTVPSAMAELVRGYDLPPSVHTVHFGGEVLPPTLVEKLRRTGAVRRIINNCGPSETTTYSTSAEIFPGAPISIGRPIANTQCYILDALLQPVPVGVTGEIYIGGAGVARGYLGRPELTAERFTPNPFGHSPRMYRSGDLGCWLPDGQILHRGRVDDQVKVRGFRVEPGEIDTALAQHPAIREAVTISRREPDGSTQLVAYLVPKDAPPQVRDLREHLRQRLPDYMVPSAFVMLTALPHTPSGKIDRRSLPEPDRNALRAGHEITEPRDAEERRVAEIWREVLKVDRLDVHDNFFDLGGHSLAAMQVASRVREAEHIEMNLLDVFERPTIAALAEVIREKGQPAAFEEGVL